MVLAITKSVKSDPLSTQTRGKLDQMTWNDPLAYNIQYSCLLTAHLSQATFSYYIFDTMIKGFDYLCVR